MCVKLLTKQHLEFLSLKGGCIGLSESTLVKMEIPCHGSYLFLSMVTKVVCFVICCCICLKATLTFPWHYHLADQGPIAQLVGSLTADPGVMSSILAPPLTLPAVVIDPEIISTVSYKRKYVHKVLVNRLFKLAQEKTWIDELIVST